MSIKLLRELFSISFVAKVSNLITPNTVIQKYFYNTVIKHYDEITKTFDGLNFNPTALAFAYLTNYFSEQV